MATKVDSSTPAESTPTHSTPNSASSPKVSIFGAKAGFVIPKNKLSGSMVPIFKGGGKKQMAAQYGSTREVQRKTKWGSDRSFDPAVRKGRVLAYQTRLEQINKLLKSGAVEMGERNELDSNAMTLNASSADNEPNKESKVLEQLELERREIIGEILALHPVYKAPPDYKPAVKQTRVHIPIQAHPEYNFLKHLLGPESNTQKRLQEETGAKIKVHGTKKETGEKSEITQTDINNAQNVYEDVYVTVSADTFDKVDAAVVLIELLLTPIAASSGATQASTPPPPMSSSDANPVVVLSTPGPESADAPQYHSYPPAWFPPNGPPPAQPTNSFQFMPLSNPASVPPYAGLPPSNLPATPAQMPPMHNMPPQSWPPFHHMPPQHNAGLRHIFPTSQASAPFRPQASLGHQPIHNVTPTGMLGPPSGAHMHPQSIPTPIRPPVSFSPAASMPLAPSQPPLNFNPSASYPSRLMPPHPTQPQVNPTARASGPVSQPFFNPHSSPRFPGPVMAGQPFSMPELSSLHPASQVSVTTPAPVPRPLWPLSSDFTFQPQRPQSQTHHPRPGFLADPRPPIFLNTPQPPSFRPTPNFLWPPGPDPAASSSLRLPSAPLQVHNSSLPSPSIPMQKQAYDTFVPAPVTGAPRTGDADPEYENLMASVGMK